MALITNIDTISTTIKDNKGTQYDIAPSGSVTIPNVDLNYENFAGGVARGWITVENWVPSDKGEVKVNGTTISVPVTLVRPADTDAYAAQDTVSNSTSVPVVLTFAGAARISGGSGYITKASIETNQSTNVAKYRLHLFHTSPTAINDNAPFTLLWANRVNRIGHIDFVACTTEGTGSDTAHSVNSDVRLAYGTVTDSTTIYGVLETLDIFTPASGQIFYISLTFDQN